MGEMYLSQRSQAGVDCEFAYKPEKRRSGKTTMGRTAVA
jgi:hypothetical protein